ncbi:hypothetical protein PRVXT_002150 [Proteinivorax tanatarense]|uniref:Uncharacterized protein n=1 Tax=Proteinivorax tanatarense TaxID=1260629 RepID=A0AAU7VJ30_9FIRM
MTGLKIALFPVVILDILVLITSIKNNAFFNVIGFTILLVTIEIIPRFVLGYDSKLAELIASFLMIGIIIFVFPYFLWIKHKKKENL